MTALDIGDYVRVSGITAPSGVKIIAPNDFNVVTVVGKRGAFEEEEEAVVEAPAEGEGAEEAGE